MNDNRTAETPGIPLLSVQTLKGVMSGYFLGLDEAARSPQSKVAWCSSIGPCELLISMGFDVYYPENHGAMLGSSRMATDLILEAVAEGYSPDICSYLTSDIGASLRRVTPLQKSYGIEAPPTPDLLFYNNNQCREVQDWFMYYARKWKVPILGVNSPRVLPEFKQVHVDDVMKQLRDLIPSLEEISGRKFDIDRLKEVVGLSKACTVRWRKVLEYSTHIPAPLTFFDHCIHMGPAVVLRGKQEAVDYYDRLLAELGHLVQGGRSSTPDERFRLYWDGMPVWGRLRWLSNILSDLGVSLVASTYCNSWLFDALDPSRPLESMARAALECFNVRDESFKERYVLDWVNRFQAQGIIFHDAKTCPYNTNSRFGMPNRLSRDHGLSTLVIHGDLNDLRCFSEEQTRTNLEAFIEQLAQTGQRTRPR